MKSLDAPYPWSRLRSTRYDHIYVSPHMDDAVYSCGGQIALARARGARVLVLTVFGHGSADERGGGGVFDDMAQRKREEQAAMDRLDLDFLWLNEPDAICRPKRPAELARYALSYASIARGELAARLYAALSVLTRRLLGEAGVAHFPLGIGFHPDHRLLHELGRALSPACTVRFYEDIPYAQVESLRRDRLRYLGHPEAPPTPLGASTRAIDRLVFPRAPAWQRPVTRLLVGGHLAGVRALFRLRGAAPRLTRTPRLVEHDIEQAIDAKVDAMRAYATQTAHFFPPGPALREALRGADGRFVERAWDFPPEPAGPVPHVTHADRAREEARVDALCATVAPP